MADADTLARRGEQEMQQNRLDQAEQTFTAAIKAAPKRGDLYHLRSRCRGSLGENEGAIADARMACKLRSERAEYHFMLARLLKSSGDEAGSDAAYREMIAACERDRARIDQDPAALSMWGDACIATGDHERAIALLTRAVELAPTLALGFATRGNAYGYLGKTDNAVSDWRRAIEIEPRYEAMLAGNIETALREKESTKLAPPHVDYAKRVIIITLIAMGKRTQLDSLWQDLLARFGDGAFIDDSDDENTCVLAMGEIRGFKVYAVLRPFDERMRVTTDFLRSSQGMFQISEAHPQPDQSLTVIKNLTKQALMTIHQKD